MFRFSVLVLSPWIRSTANHSSVGCVRSLRTHHATFATVASSIIAQPPHPPPPPEPQEDFFGDIPPLLDARVLQAAAKLHDAAIVDIVNQYLTAAGTVLETALPYEANPSEDRRPHIRDAKETCKDVITVAHCVRDGLDHKVTLSSGFALNAKEDGDDKSTLILTCAHALEEIRNWPLFSSAETNRRTKHASGTFVIAGAGQDFKVYPVSRVVSALPRSDLLLLSCLLPIGAVRTLPVSPYPAHADTIIKAHFVAHEKPLNPGWNSWIGDTWGKWQEGKVLGYRDFAGRETEPGTYDALSHLLFTPLPTAGSSGGPIVDEATGAVVGVMLGTRMDNSVEGIRGWGVPSESIFEMFSLPGLEGKR